MNKLRMFYVLAFLVLALLAPVAYQIDRASQSIPPLDGEAKIKGLVAPVSIAFDDLAIPTVTAANRADAYFTLGFLHARDRLFQMDLMRRKSAGRLSEILGEKALPTDMAQRAMQLTPAADAIAAALPDDQKAILNAYTAGVNTVIQEAKEFPPEFRLLHYRPELWEARDSMLVALGMFQTLTEDQERDERMLTIMTSRLPEVVTAFLTPDTDDYTHVYLGGNESWRPPRPVPVDAIAGLLQAQTEKPEILAAVNPDSMVPGSNNWAVSGKKTADGRAMIADDMHLPLGVPGVWYRARLNFGEHDLNGVTLPGLPVMVAGSNGRVAWGFTNVDGDFLDLVMLNINPVNADEYKTPDGWRPFDVHRERINVKDGTPFDLDVKTTIYGPVSTRPLLNRPVAVKWSARDPAAVNLGLLNMDGAASLDAAMQVMNHAGSPPQNVMLADATGHIGWTYMGFFPMRTNGFDGSISKSWASENLGWKGYIPAAELPHLTDPEEGYLATANNRTLGKAYPHVIGHSFSNGYRAYRIRQQLGAKAKLTEADMLALQLDTTSEFYEFYRQLALATLKSLKNPSDAVLVEAEKAIHNWNGRMDPDSTGIAILVRWRKELAQAVFSPLVEACVTVEPEFVYQWRQQETPLREILKLKAPATLPNHKHPDWNHFLLATLRSAAEAIKKESEKVRLDQLEWGRVNKIQVQHPFSKVADYLKPLLDMPEISGACNAFCLKVLYGIHGASERLVVSPNHPEDGILHLPGGQSGHPLSSHYRDQEKFWADGTPLPFLPGKASHQLHLVPLEPEQVQEPPRVH